MRTIGLSFALPLAGALAVQLLAPTPVSAQAATPTAAPGGEEQLAEIVVTARKREESALSAPIIMDVISAEQIQNSRIIDMPSLAAATPGLSIQPSAAAAGSVVNLRGLGNGLAASFVDQTVLLNLDNVPLSNGSYYSGALFDVGRIEILKGPQALFYGKSATGGIIAIHSADPTATWESEITQSYEFNAQELGTQAFVSGPITDQFGIRIAGFYRHTNGYLQNTNPAGGMTWTPDGPVGGGRITLKYENDFLKADLKYSVVAQHTNAPVTAVGQTACTGNQPQIPQQIPYENCKIDNTTTGYPSPKPYVPGGYGFGDTYFPTNIAGFQAGNPDPLFRNGEPDLRGVISNLALVVDWDITNELRLTSVSSFSTSTASDAGVILQNSFPPQTPVALYGAITELATQQDEQDYSQELRFTSSFSGMFNFMAGGFFGRSLGVGEAAIVTQTEAAFAGQNLPVGVYLHNPTKIATEDWSPFGQIIFTPVQQLELSAGARYSDVHKYITSIQQNSNVGGLQGDAQGEVVGLLPDELKSIHEYNLSPEATLTWRPVDTLTTFITYKQGYKGPAFNVNAAAVSLLDAGNVTPVRGEIVKGYEGGIKGSFFDRTLQASLAAYNYKYNDLQVSYANPILNTNVLANAAAARIFGVEFDSEYLIPMISGLQLNTSVYYNSAKYLSFPLAPCFSGQTAAQGCVGSVNGTGGSQNLAGQRLVNAPFVTGRVGLDYHWNMMRRYHASVGVSSELSTDYNTDTTLNPNARQGGYALLDATVRFGDAAGAWEVALMGRDLANRYIMIAGNDTNGIGVAGVPADATVEVARPLQVNLQLTVRPEKWFQPGSP
jgi:iron complex outermembrane receptor protein